MRLSAVLAAGSIAVAPASLVLGASPADAHQSPAGCNSNSLALTLTKDRTLVRNGDRTNYTVAVANEFGSACDLTNATVTLTLPAADGTPTGREVTLATGADYPAGTAHRVLGTVPYTVAVDPGVVDAVAEARTTGTLHDAPVDHAARITKTLGTDVTQPHATLTKTATPTSGEAPLAVTYNYTLTNDSSTNAPISGATVTDDRCSPVTFTGGDSNGDLLLDVGEAWTFRCSQTFSSAGTFVNIATATGTNTVDNRPVPIEPARASVTVTAPPIVSVPGSPDGPATPTVPAKPPVLGQRQRSRLAPTNSRQARKDAPCVSVPKRLSVRAGELTSVRVRVREAGRGVGKALVRITGPGFVKNVTTNADGEASFRLRPKRSGTLVIQSDQCLGADRVAVLGQRQVSSPAVPRVTG